FDPPTDAHRMTHAIDARPAAPTLLSYRPWRGTLRGPAHGTLAIARVSLWLLLRRKLFWGLYAVSAMIFLLFFYGQYLSSWLMTTVPALVLFGEYGMIDTWDYYWDQSHLLLGIIGHGVILTVTLGLLLLATACWLRRTVPMIMVWTAIFVFARLLADLLVFSM